MTSEKPNPSRNARRRRASIGPVSDLESHLPAEWWRDIFDSLYLKTDGDVVEDEENARLEVDRLIAAAGMEPGDHILDLCCGQGRHLLEFARRGHDGLTGVDRSRYLIRLARKRAKSAGADITFREGDARAVRIGESSQDYVLILGNSFGYFASQSDDARLLTGAARALKASGTLVLDLVDGDWMRAHFEPRSWEWIDQNHFVCRERSLSEDGRRLISREVIVHDERGVIADQFYAERLYSPAELQTLLEEAGFREVRQMGGFEALSERGQDLGMMGHRAIVTARAPKKTARAGVSGRAQPLDVAVIMGDPRLPDKVKRGGQFNEEDFATIQKLKESLETLESYRFRYLDNHATLEKDLRAAPPDLALNLCDEGFNNDAFMELHVPALLETLDIPYTGAGPVCLGICYDKSLVRAAAAALDVPTPSETYVRPHDRSATLPTSFPAILKPNYGDSSFGITSQAVVNNKMELVDYLEKLWRDLGDQPILVQEYLTGAEYTVGLIGNPKTGLEPMTLLEVDYSKLDPSLPKILGYESKWDPDSPYWTEINYRASDAPEALRRDMAEYAARMFERLGCRDYARFDFRATADGQVRLLEANPNPGWCWDGKMNLMAELAGHSYADFLDSILRSAVSRYGIGVHAGAGSALA